jgi:hypothetical protein
MPGTGGRRLNWQALVEPGVGLKGKRMKGFYPPLAGKDNLSETTINILAGRQSIGPLRAGPPVAGRGLRSKRPPSGNGPTRRLGARFPFFPQKIFLIGLNGFYTQATALILRAETLGPGYGVWASVALPVCVAAVSGCGCFDPGPGRIWPGHRGVLTYVNAQGYCFVLKPILRAVVFSPRPARQDGPGRKRALSRSGRGSR